MRIAVAALTLIASLAPASFSGAVAAGQAGCPPVQDGDLVQASGPEIYLVEAGALRWIPDLDTFRALGFDGGAVDPIPASCLASLPLGPPLPSVLAPLAAQASAPTPTPTVPAGPGQMAPSGVLTDPALVLIASAAEAPLGAAVTLSASTDSPGRGAYTLTVQRLRQPGGPSGGLVASCASLPTCSGQARMSQPGPVAFLATLYRCDARGVCTAERSSTTVTVTWR